MVDFTFFAGSAFWAKYLSARNRRSSVSLAHFGYTAAPTATPTPAPTEIPDGAYIDRWAKLNTNNVNFRSTPSTNGKQIKQYGKSTPVFVMESVTVEGDKWYHCLINGREGYMMARFLELETAEASQQYQNSLTTPAPVRTPVPTATPVATPVITQVPITTVAPTDIPTPVPTEAPVYSGYALTATVAQLRDTASMSGNITQHVIPGTLVSISGQTVAGGITWDQVTLVSSGRGGFINDAQLRHISEEEAQQYLAPATPVTTGTPVITQPPASYVGYALTTRTAPLKTGVAAGEMVIMFMPAETLVFVQAQTTVDQVVWDRVTVLNGNQEGYAEDNNLRHITSEEAAPYLEALQPKSTPTPVPTATPEPYQGYAMTQGSNVMLRAQADTNAAITAVLPAGDVVWVLAEEYPEADTHYWYLVRYNSSMYGYIREDQLRRMSREESIFYEEGLRTPTPSPAPTATLEPITEESLSSWGYVNTNNVRLRKEASVASNVVAMMQQYAFALVMETKVVDGIEWYHISLDGTEGYVMGNYFTVLRLGELADYLASEEYRQYVENTSNESTGTSSNNNTGNITSVEDFNSGVWTNPALNSVTYAPFNQLLATVSPNVEALPTVTPSVTPTVTIAPVATTSFVPVYTEAPTSGGGSGGLWIGLILLGAVIGGGAYGYSIYRSNRRRKAQRAAQRSQQAAAQQRNMPPVNVNRPPVQTPVSQGTQQYTAQKSAQQAPVTQRTQQFTAPKPAQQPPVSQGTQQYSAQKLNAQQPNAAFMPPASNEPKASASKPDNASGSNGDDNMISRRRSGR